MFIRSSKNKPLPATYLYSYAHSAFRGLIMHVVRVANMFATKTAA